MTVDNGSTTPIGVGRRCGGGVGVGGLASDDSGTLTFSDGTQRWW